MYVIYVLYVWYVHFTWKSLKIYVNDMYLLWIRSWYLRIDCINFIQTSRNRKIALVLYNKNVIRFFYCGLSNFQKFVKTSDKDRHGSIANLTAERIRTYTQWRSPVKRSSGSFYIFMHLALQCYRVARRSINL